MQNRGWEKLLIREYFKLFKYLDLDSGVFLSNGTRVLIRARSN